MQSRDILLSVASSAGMTFHSTPLAGLLVVERQRHRDERGSFERLFGAQELAATGSRFTPKQVNRSVTNKSGTLRGLHFQYPPRAEAKLVSCTRGSIYDVVVDLRPESPTFLHHWGTHLLASEALSLFVPTGFAHGFVSTEAESEVIYVASEQHAPECEDGLRFDDETLRIHWPVEVLHLSEKDASWDPVESRVDALKTRFSALDQDG